MAKAFDINDRTTWDWVDGEAVSGRDVPGLESKFRLNPADPGSFYEVGPDGTPFLQPCPAGLVFNPVDNVCDWPRDVTEAKIYGWAVSKGLVNDQR